MRARSADLGVAMSWDFAAECLVASAMVVHLMGAGARLRGACAGPGFNFRITGVPRGRVDEQTHAPAYAGHDIY